MYSHLGIIIGAVVSALLGFYVFVPDGSLRMFDYWLSIWQPFVWDAPAVVQPSAFEQELARYLQDAPVVQAPIFEEELARYLQQEVIEVAPFQYIDNEEIIEKLQAASDVLGPVIGPQIPPRLGPSLPPLPIHFLWVVAGVIFNLWPYFIFCLLIIALAQKTRDLRNLQTRHHEEKEGIAEQLRQKTKEILEIVKAHEGQAEKIRALDETKKILGESYKELEAEHSKVKSEKNNLETQVSSLKHNAKERCANHDAAQAQIKQQAEQIAKLKGQLTSLQGESSKIKSAKAGLELELNFLLDEAKQRDAELRQLQSESEKMKKERDAALEEVHAQKKELGGLRGLGEREKLGEAKKGQKDPVVERGSSAPGSETEGPAAPQLGTKDAGEASEDDAEEIQDAVDTPKKAGKKRRRRRRAGARREQEEEKEGDDRVG